MVSEASVMRPTRRRVLAIMAATAASAALPPIGARKQVQNLHVARRGVGGRGDADRAA